MVAHKVTVNKAHGGKTEIPYAVSISELGIALVAVLHEIAAVRIQVHCKMSIRLGIFMTDARVALDPPWIQNLTQSPGEY